MEYTINCCQLNKQGNGKDGTSHFCTRYNANTRCTFDGGHKNCIHQRKSDDSLDAILYCADIIAQKTQYGKTKSIKTDKISNIETTCNKSIEEIHNKEI